MNSEFIVEIAAGDGEPGRQVDDLAEMNRLFTAWVETVYHRRVHSETGMAPLAALDGKAAPYPGSRAGGPGRGVPLVGAPHGLQDRRWCPCTATVTRSTPAWSAGRSSWSSTRST